MCKERINLNGDEWKKFEVDGMNFLVADTDDKGKQGLAGAEPEELGERLMIFKDIVTLLKEEHCPENYKIPYFDNKDHGYGPVLFNIEIAFLDKDGKILQISYMEKERGESLPLSGCKFAIEVKHNWHK